LAIVLELAKQGANIVIDYVVIPKRSKNWKRKFTRSEIARSA
jgi:hypothetical protein